jgi:hypothetical protein
MNCFRKKQNLLREAGIVFQAIIPFSVAVFIAIAVPMVLFPVITQAIVVTMINPGVK